MGKLREKFWSDSKVLIDWCNDEELRVLGQRAAKELDSRLVKLTRQFDDNEQKRARIGRQKARKLAKAKIKRK